jgi:hypothetical protein
MCVSGPLQCSKVREGGRGLSKEGGGMVTVCQGLFVLYVEEEGGGPGGRGGADMRPSAGSNST